MVQDLLMAFDFDGFRLPEFIVGACRELGNPCFNENGPESSAKVTLHDLFSKGMHRKTRHST
jgi:hypothetical protein